MAMAGSHSPEGAAYPLSPPASLLWLLHLSHGACALPGTISVALSTCLEYVVVLVCG
jgi:hypothetical protein